MSASNRASLFATARRQFGVFTRRQAVEAGVTRRAVDRWVASGEVSVIHPDVYLVAGTPPLVQSSWMAGQLWVGGDAMLARQTAAQALRLPVPADGKVHVLVRDRSFEEQPDNLVVHRAEQFGDRIRHRLGPLDVTVSARTVVDLARSLTFIELRRLLGEVLRHGLCTVDDIRIEMDWVGSFRGIRQLRQILDEASPLIEHTRNEFEGRFLDLTTQAGIPPSAMNHPVRDAAGTRRELDAVYLPEKVPVELDGRRWHGLNLDRNDDTDRENQIALKGWRPFLRFTWWQVTRQGPMVVRTIRDALDAARA